MFSNNKTHVLKRIYQKPLISLKKNVLKRVFSLLEMISINQKTFFFLFFFVFSALSNENVFLENVFYIIKKEGQKT